MKTHLENILLILDEAKIEYDMIRRNGEIKLCILSGQDDTAIFVFGEDEEELLNVYTTDN